MKAILKLLGFILIAPFLPFIAVGVLFVVGMALCIWWELVKYIWGDALQETFEFAIVFVISVPLAFIILNFVDKCRGKKGDTKLRDIIQKGWQKFEAERRDTERALSRGDGRK